jgi:hypothetical protein
LIAGEDGNSNPTATLYLQQPDGSFQKAGAKLTGVSTGTATSIADVDGQNGPDLLIAGEDGNSNPTTTLYLQQPDGSFQEADAGLTGVLEASTSIADIDQDGAPDLLIAGFDKVGTPTTTLYLQQPDGGFQEAGGGLTGVGHASTSIADVDGQNGPDLLIAGGEGENRDPTTTLYLQQPDGSFQEAGAGLIGIGAGLGAAGSTSIADVDGQNGPDLLIAVGNENRDPTTTLYLQQPDGSFQKADAGLTGVVEASTDIADMDQDGDLDLLVGGTDGLFRETSTRLYVNRTNQPGFNEAPVSMKPVPSGQQALGTPFRVRFEFGDRNGDKLSLDLTEGGSVLGTTFTDAGNGTGEFEFMTSASQVGETFRFSVEARDGNGGSASVSFEVEVPEVVEAVGAGLTGVEFGVSTSIADVDGQNGPDLLVAGKDGNGNPTATLYLQQSNGTFQEAGAELTGVSFGASTAIADVDGRNGPDLLIAGGETATLYFQQPDGSFREAGAGLTGVEDGSISIADIDGENGPDLLIAGEDGNSNPTTTLYLQQPDGSFQEADAGLSGVREPSTSIADIDQDGAPDLLIAGFDKVGTPTTTLYLQQPDGGFQEAGGGLTGVGHASTSIADVDGQNGPDLLIAGEGERDPTTTDPTTTLYLQGPDGSFREANVGLTGAAFSSTVADDVNGDGAVDLLVTGRDKNFNLMSTLYLQQPGGSFEKAGAGLIGVAGSGSIAEVDGDGDPNLLVAGGDQRFKNSNLGDGTTTLYDNLLKPAEGAAQKQVTSSGAVAFDGTGTTIDFGSGTSGEGPARVVKFGRAPLQRPGLPSGTNVSQYRFVVETSRFLQTGSGTEIRFDVSTLGGTPSPGDIRVFRRDPPGAGRFDLVPSSSAFSEVTGASYDAGSGELVVPTTEFGEFVFVSDSDPLPVELASFEGAVTEDGGDEVARLRWETASETGNAGFEVQRRTASAGGSDWETVGRREGAGTTSRPRSYEFIDERLPYQADTLQYRLQQVDIDGTVHATDPISIARGGPVGLELLGTAPNPARSRATVRYAIPEDGPDTGERASLRIYDTLGREVRSVQIEAETGRHERTLDLQSLPSGVYFLRLRAGGESVTRKLTVVR